MTRVRLLLPALSALAAAWPFSQAGALDCTRASTVVEHALCATPDLLAQDAALSKAYADRLAQEPGRAAELRTEQRAWLSQRERLCGGKTASPSRVAACLTGLARARLAALGAGSTSSPETPAPPAAVLPSPPRPALPDLPAQASQPDAVLARSAVPASGRADVALEVRVPGRFAITSKSASGVALQLVDMIAGPGEEKGVAGKTDGRIDALLDRGTYRLRVAGAAGATGEAQLSVRPFRDAAELSNALTFGGDAEATLTDLTQRSFWVAVAKPGRVSVEAVGRSLRDLRLWRNGTDLAALDPRLDRITPRTGHALTRARLDGQVEPGLYLATAYGGPKLAWSDGDPAEPLLVHAGLPAPLPGNWVEGVVGPTGSARFAAPERASSFRLELPETAGASLSVLRGTEAPALGAVQKNSREPVADVTSAPAPDRVVEVAGQEGQPFRLRALDPAASRQIAGTGATWVGVDVAGAGGDELPATVVLAQFQGTRGAHVLASSAPQIGPGRPWRQKLNLRGKSTLLFEVLAPLQVGVTLAGPRVEPAIAPLLGNAPPRSDGQTPRWSLEAGWYVLTLAPVNNAVGVLDLTLGPVGVAGTAQTQAPQPSIPLGIVQLKREGDYRLLSNDAPGLVIAPTARALPADLAAGPLTLEQMAEQALDIPVRSPARGSLAAMEVNGVPVPVQRAHEGSGPDGQVVTLHIPAPQQARGLVLSWSDPAPADAALTRLPDNSERETVEAGKPRFFDLARDEARSFTLEVAEGGLYRVETLGRLHASLAVGTGFRPRLDSASANGAGENALTQSYLRAGRYTVDVKASDSSGRVGLLARPAALPEGATLVPGTSARAALADGRGAVFPIAIAEAGRYRLDLDALGKPLRARLEDEDGWPLTTPGPITAIERAFEPGRYRLVVLPEPVDTRTVVRLARLLPPPELSGHGPHPLGFDRPSSFQWREPASTSEARDPDRWTFSLAGPADIRIDLSAGMTGTLLRAGAERALGRIVAKAGFSGRLPPGDYVLEARSLGRNDRLDYTVTLASREVQPGAPRRLDLPATIGFAIADSRVVSLTTQGRTELRGLLKDAEGRLVERLGSRADDWNLALSRQLPAGAYTLDLSAADPRPPKESANGAAEESPPEDGAAQAGKPVGDQPADAGTPAKADEPADGEAANAPADDADNGPAATAPDDADQPPMADRPDASGDHAQVAPARAGEEAKAAAEQSDTTETEALATGVEVRLALPPSDDRPGLAVGVPAEAVGPQVHRFPLPPVPTGRLMVLAARSGQDLVLSLERADAAGHWTAVGFARDRTPLVAALSDGDAARPWRASVWAVDGGPARMDIGFQTVERMAAPVGTLDLQPIDLGPMARDVRAALVAAPSSALLSLFSRPDGLLEGSVAGQALRPVADPILVPQAEATWIVARGPAPAGLAVARLAMAGTGVALTIPAGERATLPAPDVLPGMLRAWRAASSFGQPGLSAGRGFGVAPGSAAALAGDAPPVVWNAAGQEPLAVHVDTVMLTRRPALRAETAWGTALPQGMAQPVELASGPKRLTLDLAPGTAAVLGAAGPDPVTVWSGAAPVSRTLDGDWTEVLLLNLSGGAGPVRISVAPLAGQPAALSAGAVVKRFYGASGSIALRLAAAPGDRLVVAGAEATVAGDDGQVARGRNLALSGSGEVILDHAPGLVAAWVERAGLSPWPEAQPQAVALPSVLPLAGPAMALTLHPEGGVLLHARTSAPVILSLSQGGQSGEPAIFPAGAEFFRLLAAGDAILHAYPPHDGPLAGSLELTAVPVTPVAEGLGETVALAPGSTALFAFDVRKRAPIGVGLRAEPDIVSARLLDATGRSLGSGLAQLQTLDPGRYLLEASVPADGRTTMVRPAVVGLSPAPTGPPPDVIRDYLQLVGLAPTAPTP